MVKVAELKARLSAYLARVRRGETVVVCGRSTPIARLVPYEEADVQIEEPIDGESLSGLDAIEPIALVDVVEALRETRDQS